jgi:hypothetical protein
MPVIPTFLLKAAVRTFQTLKNLPEPTENHCLVIVDSERLFVTGGGLHTKTYLYQQSINKWTALPDSPTQRYGPGCGLVTSQGKREILVAAGKHNGVYFDTVDIFDLDVSTWRSGAQFTKYKTNTLLLLNKGLE